MAKTVTIPGSSAGTVLVGTSNPPTTSVACQLVAATYDPGATFSTSPPVPSYDGRTTYIGRTPTLTLAWLADAGATDSLSDFLEDNEGGTVYVKLKATSTAAATYTYTCQAVPGGDLIGAAGVVIATTAILPVLARVKT